MMIAVTAATVIAAAVIAAGMAFTVVIMVITPDIGIEVQDTGKEGFHRFIGVAADTAEQPDTGCCQRHLSTTADTTANEGIRIQSGKQGCQRAVTAAIGIYHLGCYDLSILNIINFKLGSMSKMLENITVFVGNCNSHH